jgi:putative glutamine amidotransferase
LRPRVAIPEPCSYDPEYSRRALPPYVQAVQACGGEPVIIRLDSSPEEVARTVSGCDAVLLPGSKADVDPQKYGAEKDPRTALADGPRDAADELLLQDAYSQRKPILGICYGLQALNVWRSGTLVQHIESSVNHSPGREIEFAHQAHAEPGTTLATLLGDSPATLVNSSHHQAAEQVGDGLRVAARCPADRVIEAIEGTDPAHYVIAVQWHPERTFQVDAPSQKLFESLIEAGMTWQRSRNSTEQLR